MESALSISEKMREEATCSICLQLMTKPVNIDCGHSFCRLCLVDITKNQHSLTFQGMLNCPLCRSPFQSTSLRPNKQLENLIEIIKEMDHDVCKDHGEQLHLFCEDDGQLICWRCEWAPQHKGHLTALVEDVYQSYKKKLQEAATTVRVHEYKCRVQKLFTEDQIKEWEEKIELKRQEIQSDFTNLHNFLHEEEKSYLWKLEKEREQILKRLRDSEVSLDKKSHELQTHILELEEKCQGSAQNLLQDVKNTLIRSSGMKLETPEDISLDIHTICNVPEFYFDLKTMLKHYQVSVTLDPDTPHHELILSEDQRQVTCGCNQRKIISSRRFSILHCVLGCESFTSGRYYFEVDVGEGTQWDLGVCLENVPRDITTIQGPHSGFWVIRLCNTKGYIALTSPLTSLPLKEKPLVVGVFLDYEAGLVSFYNMTTGSHIFTFPKATFSDTLRPFFQVYHYSPLFLPPPHE